MNIREDWPDFVRSDEEIHYYQTTYDDLIAAKVQLEYRDRHLLGVLASNLNIMDIANDSLSSDGLVQTHQGDRKEVTKTNPAVAMYDKAVARVIQCLKEFGMSPNSRTSSFSLGDKGDGTGSKIGKFMK